MARATFGGGIADFVTQSIGGGILKLSSATLTFWSAKTGGTQHTDLLLDGTPTATIAVGSDGQVPAFQGPDGVTAMWADGGGTRVQLAAIADVIGLVGSATATAVTAEIANRGLVSKTDPGIPTTATAVDETDIAVTLDAVGRVVDRVDQYGRKVFPAGHYDGTTLTTELPSDQYLAGRADTNGNVFEDAIGLDGRVPQWVLDAQVARMDPRKGPFAVNPTVLTKTVKLDGTGDYTSIKAACAALANSDSRVFYDVVVYPGRYDEVSIAPAFNTRVRGLSRSRCIVAGYLPPSSTDATINVTSTFDVLYTGQVENLTISAQNMRYPIHSDGAGTNPDQTIDGKRLTLIHYGNQEARDWRIANPGSGMAAATVWDSWIAYGYGSASGMVQRFKDCTFRGRSTYYIHNARDFTKPTVNELVRCRFVALDDATPRSLTVNPIGSGTPDELIVVDGELDVAYVQEQDGPWSSSKPERQYANHSEIAMTFARCNPVGFVSNNRGKALRITSASTGATSTVRVTGTAADDIFGTFNRWTYRDGGGGLKGYAYSYWDISGILTAPGGTTEDTAVNNTLGKRLGNCSTTSKTLTVTVDGGTPVNVVFNTDLTAATNATIIASINTALGAAAVADEYLVSQGETYPHFTERERTLVNSGTVGIPRWAPVKYGATQRSVVLCTASDPASAFVGFALEPIPPGVACRVLTEGCLRYDQINGYTGGAGAIVAGTALSLSGSTDGAVVAGAAKQILTGYQPDWARFKGAS